MNLWLSEDEDKFEERVALLASQPETNFAELMNKSQMTSAKNATLAENFMMKGEGLLRDTTENQKGLQCLSKALSLADQDQRERILMHRCRAFLDSGMVSEALDDCNELDFNDEDSLQLRAQVLLSAGHHAEAEKLTQQIDGMDINNVKNQVKHVPHKEELEKTAENWVVGFSSKVFVQEDKERGRYLVAAEPMEAGECFAKDVAPPRLLIPAAAGRCWHCLAPVAPVSPRPCHNCSSVSYCSWKCAHTAWDSYHKYNSS
jgi:tetratricopeptide (TPR) repeat protein